MSRENRDDGEADDVLEAEALMLLGRLQADDGDGPLDAMLALTAFEERSERHRIALAQVFHVWTMTGLIDPATLAVAPATAPHSGTAAVPRRMRAGFFRRTAGVSRPLGMIAAAAAVAAGVALLVIPPVPPEPPTMQDYATARGETRPIRLADGSRIMLGAGTKLSAGFAGDRRIVRLLAGQALFTVAHDASRPFVVTAGTMTVRDIGTVFSITRHADATTIAVVEGMVAASASGATAVRVAAGRQLRVDRTGQGRITAIVPGMTNGWEEGLLRYRRTPLSDVIADINRYAAEPLHLADPAIARLPYSGTVRADAIGEWVVALPYAFPVTIRHRGNGVDILPRGATVDQTGR